MNYRHAFHAGNFADVLKHTVVAVCIQRLNAKETPWRYIDTHAGIGLYDLDGDEAARSPEWRDGVGRILSAIGRAPQSVQDGMAAYLDAVRAVNEAGRLASYPGSPVIAQGMARADDALRLCELHPESCALLREAMGRDRRVKIEERNGYEALSAYLPPPERRGLVLVDPPFEEGTQARKLDFEKMLRAARQAVKRWPQGIYIFWRPLKHLDAVEAFDGDLATLLIEEMGLPPEKLLVADLWVKPLDESRMAGAGVVIVNPPWGLSSQLEVILPWLAETLDQSAVGDPAGSGWRLVAPDAEG
ncbi:MAG: 23S rRNA (adenine(2030)-N(6))-methyltransferase RlmJ [Hyphomonadaceae bacterium]